MNPFAIIGNIIADRIEIVLKQKFDEYIPVMIKAAIVAVNQSAGQLVVNVTDRTTDIIPGELDDKILDGLANTVRDHLERLGVKL